MGRKKRLLLNAPLLAALLAPACAPEPRPVAPSIPAPQPAPTHLAPSSPSALPVAPAASGEPADRGDKPLVAPASACAPLPALPLEAPSKTDQSKAFDPGDGYLLALPDAPDVHELRLCGRVTEIRAGSDGETVVIEGASAAESGTVRLRLPSKVQRPFGAGDTISVHLVVRRIAIHRVLEGTIADREGTVLVAFSQDGSLGFAPGWGMEEGPVAETGKPHMTGGARRRTHAVRLSFAGKTALVPAGQWRRLSTPAGSFLVTGSAVSWTEGPRPPDAAAYRHYAIVRTRNP